MILLSATPSHMSGISDDPTSQSCTFPFTYQNVSYNGCMQDDDSMKSWCPLLKDGTSSLGTSREKQWQPCNSTCPSGKFSWSLWAEQNKIDFIHHYTERIKTPSCFTEKNGPCIFPVLYKGELLNSCLENRCPTIVDDKGIPFPEGWHKCKETCHLNIQVCT